MFEESPITRREVEMLKSILAHPTVTPLSRLEALASYEAIAPFTDHITLSIVEWDFSELEELAQDYEDSQSAKKADGRSLELSLRRDNKKLREEIAELERKLHSATEHDRKLRASSLAKKSKGVAPGGQRLSKKECASKIHQMFYEVGSIVSGDPWFKEERIDKNQWYKIIAEMVELGQIAKTKIRHNRYTYSRTEKLPAPRSAAEVRTEAVQLELIPTSAVVSANN